jgi:hypothetical protein
MLRKYVITGGLIVTLDDSLSDSENGAILIEVIGRPEDKSADGAEITDAY